MHKFIKHGEQEPPRKLCKLCDFTCLTTGGLRFHQNVKHLGLKGPPEFKNTLCDYRQRTTGNADPPLYSAYGGRRRPARH